MSFYSGHVERGVEIWAEALKKSAKGYCDIDIIGNDVFPINWEIGDSRNKFLRFFFLDYWSRSIARFTYLKLTQLTNNKYDIIIPTNGGWQSLMIRLYTLIHGGKMIIVGHSGRGWDERWNIYMCPDLFIALSGTAKEWAKRTNWLLKTAYVPNGVFLQNFTTTGIKEKIKLPHPIYLFVGALESGKGPDLAIKAVSRIKGSLLMLGRGKMHDSLQSMGTHLLGDRFMLTSVPNSEIPKYYRAADVFTLPTWSNEAFGIVYLEAMACGLPVVTTDDATRREIVGDAGLFVNPQDINAYAKSLIQASKIDWGTIPRAQAQKFAWEKVASQYINIFKELTK